jgi:hypothetical protein
MRHFISQKIKLSIDYSAKAKNDTNPENGLYLLVYSCYKSKLIDVSPNTRLDKFYSFNAD